MKKLALATLLMLLATLAFANYYTIGTSTNTNKISPLMTTWRYNWCKTIYSLDAINDAGLTSPALISEIAFFSGEIVLGYTDSDQRIYARHTDANFYSEGDTAYPDLSEFELVFQGDVTFSGWGWFYIKFDTPFAWNGNQNIEFHFEDRGFQRTALDLYFRSSVTQNPQTVYRYQDSSFPSDQPGSRYRYLANIKLITIPDTSPDAAVMILPHDGTIYSTLQPELRWDHGDICPEGYRLNLGTGYPPTDVYDNLDLGQITSYIPSTELEEDTTYYWQLVPYNYLGDASHCPIWNFSTYPERSVTLGHLLSYGTHEPFIFRTTNSLCQILYRQSELGFAHGTITDLKFYNLFTEDILDVPIRIWMGSTSDDNLVDGFVSAEDLTLVFEGNIDFIAGKTEIPIVLTTPYLHTPRNLIVSVARTGGPPHPNPFYHYFFGNSTLRGQVLTSFPTENPDPYDPPLGSISGVRPTTTFSYKVEPIKTDLDCIGLTGTSTPRIGIEENYTVKLRNNGYYTADDYQIMLIQEGGDVLCTVDGPSIDCGETKSVTLSWTPTSTDPIYIYAKVVVTYDEYPQNNESKRLNISAQPPELHVSTIGNSDSVGAYPITFYYKSYLFQGIYYPEELGFENSSIRALKFYSRYSSNVVDEEIKIWMLSTDSGIPTEDFLRSPDFTLVFEGTISIPFEESEVVITLDTPYFHTTGNLVLMFYRPYNEKQYGIDNAFRTIREGRARAFGSNTDNIDPMDPSFTYSCLAESYPIVSIFHTATTVNDLGCLDITGNRTPTVGEPCTYTVNIRNNGVYRENDYLIKLFTEDGVEVASASGPSINPMQSLLAKINWTPTTAGDAHIYAKIFLDGDEHEDNDQSELYHVSVQPEDIVMITVGTGNEDSHIPMFFNRKSSLYECIYLEEELGYVEGAITAIKLYNHFPSAIPNGAVKIWLGNTHLPNLSNRFIPSRYLTPVFEGNVNFPAGQNEILIPLITPYTLTSDNLVLLIQHPGGYYQIQDDYYFQCQTDAGNNRARFVVTDSHDMEYNPDTPPTTMLIGQYPKISFFHSDEPIQYDLACFGLTGNTTPTAGLAYDYFVHIKNSSSYSYDNYQVKLYMEGDIEIASIPGPPISAGQTLQLALNWTPTTEGNAYLYAQVELDQDQNEQNDRTSNLDIYVNPSGNYSVDVGTGYLKHVMPFNMTFKNSLCQTLFFPHDLNGFVGHITGMQLYGDFESEVEGSNIQVWAGTTDRADLMDGSIPASLLTLVFDGILDFPAGESGIMIPFNHPFAYLNGENLVLTLYRSDAAGHIGNNMFQCQSGSTIGRTINYFSDTLDIDPMDSVSVIRMNEFPQATFFVIPSEVGYISGRVVDLEGPPLANASISLDQGRYTALTNMYGYYTLRAPEGIYKVSCVTPNHFEEAFQNIPIYVGQTTYLNFVLENVDNPEETVPAIATTLHHNYPNPFNPETTISYSIKESGAVRLDIFNIKGQLIKTLVNEDKPSGHHKAIWNGRDASGRACSSGIYFYCLRAPGYRKINKMLLSK